MRATTAGESTWRGVVGAAVALALAVTLLAPSFDERRQEAEQRAEDVERRAGDAHDELEGLEQDHAATAEELAEVEERLAAIEEELAEREVELARAREALAEAEAIVERTQEEIDGTEGELAAVEAERDDQRDAFGERVRTTYMHGGVDPTMAVLTAQDVDELGRRSSVARSVMANDVERIEGLVALEARIDGVLDRLAELERRQRDERRAAEAEADRVAELVEEQQELRAAAEAEADEQRRLLAEIEDEQQRYEERVAELEAQSDEIAAQLRQIAAEEEEHRREQQRREEQRREEQRREEQRVAEQDSPSRSDASEGGGGGGGALARPIDAPITSSYGYRTHPITGQRRLHAGIDYGAPTGTPIRAADGGTVVTAGGMGGYGVTVIIDHGGGKSTLYAHQSRLAVSRGQSVGRGEVIGYVGSTGFSTGPHLHFEVRVNGTPTNPAPHL